ncbi:MAG: hypothetical protein HOM11_09675 [Methylococcales bacterium]|jgi:small ligand-binding sensory domain FIST|nr:hypothetical protein [Methylococcales bacterium]MBT7442428.1 hypothetical protein [Methylococcales bacterium]
MKFQSAISTDNEWQTACDACLEQLADREGYNLGFISDRFQADFSAIVEVFKKHTGIDTWVGSVGLGIIGPSQEVYEQGAISVLLGQFPEDSFRLIPSIDCDPKAFVESEQDWITRHNAYLAVVHGDPMNPSTQETIQKLSDELATGFLVGGLSSAADESTAQFSGVEMADGLSGVLFSSEVEVGSGLTQGCSPISDYLTVTKCDKNMMFSLDNQPALDVYKEIVGAPYNEDLNLAVNSIFFGLPIKSHDSRDYLVRNIVGIALPIKCWPLVITCKKVNR